jgi:hypothetical protein
MGQRSRKRRSGERLRGEARNEELRANLEPLAPGERPLAVSIGAVIAALLGLSNLVLLAAGYDLRGGEDPQSGGVIAFAVVMFVAAVFMWRGKYWAVLGFQCLLAITAVAAGLGLLVASNLAAVALSLAVLAASGTLFWFLIKAMARLQMPERPGARAR